jgi:hypothetical protein
MISDAMDCYQRGRDALASGDTERLETLAREWSGFPHGEDSMRKRRP